MTRINLKHTKYVNILDRKDNVLQWDTSPKPKMNTATYSVYISLLTLICISTLIGIMVLGLYTLKLINTTPFYSIIAN